MQRSLPKYRINYRYCQQIGHEQEKTNLVCLQKSCVENALICSFCIEERHQGHSIKPLKHFLENLQKLYSNSSHLDIDQKLEQLQCQKQAIMEKIQKAVQTLAISFQELQEQVINQYELMKSQVISQIMNKNRFKEFYHKMAFEQKGDPNFQIQNYLNFDPIISFDLGIKLEEFVSQTNKNLQQIKRRLVVKQNIDFTNMISEPLVKITEKFQQKFVIPSSIKRVGNIFCQNQIASKQTVCYYEKLMKDWTGKLRIKVISLQQKARLTIGVAYQNDLINQKHQFKFKGNFQCYHLNRKGGVVQNQNANYIKSIKTGDILDITIKKNKFRISSNGNVCKFDIYEKNKSMFFFNLQGLCSIQINFPTKTNDKEQ